MSTILQKTVPQFTTVEEYILFEEQSPVRHELINFQLIEMPGTTDDHNYICQNLVVLLRQLFKGTGVKVYNENVKVQITSEKDYTYPDVMVVPDPRDAENKYIKKYPSIIIEVLSKSSKLDDSTDKFLRYRQIESLENYVLIDSERVLVEVRTKDQEGNWSSETYLAADQTVSIPAIGAVFALADMYEGVEWYVKGTM